MSSPARTLHIGIEKLFGRWTDFLFTQSGEDAATAIAERIMPAGRVEAIGNGVVLSDFANVAKSAVHDWRERLSLPHDSIVVGTVGRLVAEKGYREWFQAASVVASSQPSAVFLIVGAEANGERDRFSAAIAEMLAADRSLAGRVRFTGFTVDIPPLLELIDIFVLASYREGMPRSIIEAMASGKPVVASDIRGCREEVIDGVTGFLVPVHDAPALANRIEALVRDPDLREELGLAGRRRAEKVFDEAKVIERLMDRIDQLLEERGLNARSPSP
jgi:glycosyltransferase involved in cell wall biosynthesis